MPWPQAMQSVLCAGCCSRAADQAGLGDGDLTELTTPSWPRNFRMTRPVLTSHRNTWRSPPHDANLQGSEDGP